MIGDLSCRPGGVASSAEEKDELENTSEADLPEFDEPVRRTSFLDMLQQTATHSNEAEVHISPINVANGKRFVKMNQCSKRQEDGSTLLEWGFSLCSF